MYTFKLNNTYNILVPFSRWYDPSAVELNEIPTFLIDILLSDLENLGFALQIPMNCVYREKQRN